MATKQARIVREKRGSRATGAGAKQASQLWLDPDLRAQIAVIQAHEKCTMGELIRSAVVEFIKRHYAWATNTPSAPEEPK